MQDGCDDGEVDDECLLPDDLTPNKKKTMQSSCSGVC